MGTKNYESPKTKIVRSDPQDVIRTSGYVEATDGFDDNVKSWEEVFAS